MQTSPKPARPFGITLAIFLSVLLFTVIPMLQFGFFMFISRPIVEKETGLIMGIDLGGISSGEVFIQTFIALSFLMVAIFAWRGKPASIRQILTGGVIAVTVFNVVFGILPSLLSRPDVATSGIDSSYEFSRQLRSGQLVSSILVMLYVVWYLNRWPARAFYRGYYLPEELEALRQLFPSAFSSASSASHKDVT